MTFLKRKLTNIHGASVTDLRGIAKQIPKLQTSLAGVAAMRKKMAVFAFVMWTAKSPVRHMPGT
jgi:hypothetical protein